MQALAAVVTLYPGLHPRGSLSAFRALDRMITIALKGSTPKRERKRRSLYPMRDISHLPAWTHPSTELVFDEGLTDDDRQALRAQGFRPVDAIRFHTTRPDIVLAMVSAVLPVVTRDEPDYGLLIAPL